MAFLSVDSTVGQQAISPPACLQCGQMHMRVTRGHTSVLRFAVLSALAARHRAAMWPRGSRIVAESHLNRRQVRSARRVFDGAAFHIRQIAKC